MQDNENAVQEQSTNSVLKNWFQDTLQNQAMVLLYQKADGTTREMRCTLQPEELPEQTVTESTKKKVSNPDVLAVWDLDKNAWRSINVERASKIRPIEQTKEMTALYGA